MRSILLERLLPATEYSLRVVAIYLDRLKLTSEQVRFISPTDNESRRFKENTYRPIHRYPDEPPKQPAKIGLALVRNEELTIVAIAIVFWIATICLFFNKWGKIRMLEPYQPAYREQVVVPPVGGPFAVAAHLTASGHNLNQLAAAAASSQSPGSGSQTAMAGKPGNAADCPSPPPRNGSCGGGKEELAATDSTLSAAATWRKSTDQGALFGAVNSLKRFSTVLGHAAATPELSAAAHRSAIATRTDLNYVFQSRAAALAKASLMWPTIERTAASCAQSNSSRAPLGTTTSCGVGGAAAAAANSQKWRQQLYRTRLTSSRGAQSQPNDNSESIKRLSSGGTAAAKCLLARRNLPVLEKLSWTSAAPAPRTLRRPQSVAASHRHHHQASTASRPSGGGSSFESSASGATDSIAPAATVSGAVTRVASTSSGSGGCVGLQATSAVAQSNSSMSTPQRQPKLESGSQSLDSSRDSYARIVSHDQLPQANKLRRLQLISKLHRHPHFATSGSASTLVAAAAAAPSSFQQPSDGDDSDGVQPTSGAELQADAKAPRDGQPVETAPPPPRLRLESGASGVEHHILIEPPSPPTSAGVRPAAATPLEPRARAAPSAARSESSLASQAGDLGQQRCRQWQQTRLLLAPSQPDEWQADELPRPASECSGGSAVEISRLAGGRTGGAAPETSANDVRGSFEALTAAAATTTTGQRRRRRTSEVLFEKLANSYKQSSERRIVCARSLAQLAECRRQCCCLAAATGASGAQPPPSHHFGPAAGGQPRHQSFCAGAHLQTARVQQTQLQQQRRRRCTLCNSAECAARQAAIEATVRTIELQAAAAVGATTMRRPTIEPPSDEDADDADADDDAGQADQQATGRGAGTRSRVSSVFAAAHYSHRDSFAMLRALSQKKSKSAEDVAYLSSLVLQIWSREPNRLLQSVSYQHLGAGRQRQQLASSATTAHKWRRQSAGQQHRQLEFDSGAGAGDSQRPQLQTSDRRTKRPRSSLTVSQL